MKKYRISEFTQISTLALLIGLGSGAPVNAATWVVEWSKVPGKKELAELATVAGSNPTRLSPVRDRYFDRVYRVEISAGDEAKGTPNRVRALNGVQRVEESREIDAQSIIPVKNPTALTNDPLLSLQWALQNEGQTILKDIDDIRSLSLVGTPGIDLNWKGLRQSWESRLGRVLRVAVIDSGLDYEHPEIADQLDRNTAECDASGGIPFNPTVDKDGNGYVGDCVGWNFTGKPPKGNNRPTDDVGHGTHVSGILAATSGNAQGVAGLSNSIRILPLKVLAKTNKVGPGAGQGGVSGLSDRVAEAVTYAAARGVDVINLSLGWPKILDTEFLRQSFRLAAEKGVIVVAAAGNNSHDDPVFPCSYESVICVGAVDPRGAFASFSNFGGRVDVLGPGDTILSLFPRTLETQLFPGKGYEIKSGTSQASPYVAGLVGLLRVLLPGASVEEIRARLALSAGNFGLLSSHPSPVPMGRTQEKWSNWGMPQLEKAMDVESQPMIEPLFKGIGEVIVSSERKMQISLPVVNRWAPARDVEVQVTSPGLEILNSTFSFDRMDRSERKVVTVFASANSLSQDNRVRIQVLVKVGGKVTGVFQDVLALSMDLREAPGAKVFPLRTSERFSLSQLRTVSVPYPTAQLPEYYRVLPTASPNPSATPGPTLIEFYRATQNDEYRLAFPAVELPSQNQVLQVMKLDLNLDGVEDYWIRTLVKTQGQQFIEYRAFRASDASPLLGDFSNWRFEPEVAVENFQLFGFQKREILGLGQVRVMCFLASGQIPKGDQPQGPWAIPDRTELDRLYCLEPVVRDGQVSLETRTLATADFFKKLARVLGLSRADTSTIDIQALLPQQLEQLKSGEQSLLVSFGASYPKKWGIVTVRNLTEFVWELGEQSLPGLEQGNFVSGSLLESNQVSPRGAAGFISFYSPFTARTNGLQWNGKKWRVRDNGVYQHPRSLDQLVGLVGRFHRENDTIQFFQSGRDLLAVAQGAQGQQSIAVRTIYRFSFLPDTLFSELFFPVSLGVGSRRFPALFIDATALSSNHLELLTLEGTAERPELKSPIEFSLRVPKECVSLNPTLTGAGSLHALMAACQVLGLDGSWSAELRMLPLSRP